MRLPLTNWTLRGSLPDRLLADEPSGFSLPGAQALCAFSGLLGDEVPAQEESREEAREESQKEPREASAPFALPAMLPDDAPGCVRLTREVDFGSLRGDRALLQIDCLAGRGEVLLDDQVLARFDGGRASPDAAALTGTPCMLAVDLTDALNLGRRRTLTLRFDASRPAGACGPVFLVTTERAFLAHVTLAPDARARTVSLRAQIRARCAGRYVLRAQPVSPSPSQEPPAAREISLDLAAGETREASLSMALEAEAFVPGKAYAAAAVKCQLLSLAGGREWLCDEALLLCGYPARRACAHVPLTLDDCAGDPRALAARLTELRIPAVSLPALMPDAVYRALCRAGIGVRQFAPEDGRAALARYPNVLLFDAPVEGEPLSPEAIAWQLCAMTALPRALDGTLTPRELLAEAAGRALDPDDAGVRSVLSWLSAVYVRMRAEAARQGRVTGSLCAPGALAHEDIREALRTAFAPLHLSALPLYGAWWTGTHFSATVAAFLPEEETRALTAAVLLEDENGGVLAQLNASLASSGELGVLHALLPEHPCVLTLICRLMDGEKALEEHALPVYVGERGPLEAAFA